MYINYDVYYSPSYGSSLWYNYAQMEFEKNKPATAEDIALADTPKVTLQPVHGEIRTEPINNNYTHQNEASFKFEAESTDAAALAAGSGSAGHPRHGMAVIVSLATAVVFGLVLFGLYSLR